MTSAEKGGEYEESGFKNVGHPILFSTLLKDATLNTINYFLINLKFVAILAFHS